MKQLIILPLLFLSFVAKAQSIPLDSIYVPGATWTEAVYDIDHSNYHTTGIYYMAAFFRIERDTVIGGKNYLLLSASQGGDVGWSYSSTSTTADSFYTKGIIDTFHIFGRLRVDGNKVYFTRDSSNVGFGFGGAGWQYSHYTLDSEYLLYNFNLTNGTVMSDTIRWPDTGAIIYRTDSVAISPGRYIPRYWDSVVGYNNSYEYWIDGLGSNNGFLDFSLFDIGPLNSLSLEGSISLCYYNPWYSYNFHQNAQFAFNGYEIAFLDTLLNNCFDVASALAVNDPVTLPMEQIIVFPNPIISSNFSFVIAGADNVVSVQVFDIAGRQLSAAGGPFHKGENELSLHLDPGLYILKFTFANGTVITRKVVKE